VTKCDGVEEELLEIDDEVDDIELEVEPDNSPPLHAPRIKANAIKVVILTFLEFIFPLRINNLINLLY
jgi:hypothetical protein